MGVYVFTRLRRASQNIFSAHLKQDRRKIGQQVKETLPDRSTAHQLSY